jgi:hypothetical protein
VIFLEENKYIMHFFGYIRLKNFSFLFFFFKPYFAVFENNLENCVLFSALFQNQILKNKQHWVEAPNDKRSY